MPADVYSTSPPYRGVEERSVVLAVVQLNLAVPADAAAVKETSAAKAHPDVVRADEAATECSVNSAQTAAERQASPLQAGP